LSIFGTEAAGAMHIGVVTTQSVVPHEKGISILREESVVVIEEVIIEVNVEVEFGFITSSCWNKSRSSSGFKCDWESISVWVCWPASKNPLTSGNLVREPVWSSATFAIIEIELARTNDSVRCRVRTI